MLGNKRLQYLLFKSFGILFLSIALLIFPSDGFSKTDNSYYIQIGSFKIQQNAIRLAAGFKDLQKKASIREYPSAQFGLLYQVLIGPFPSRQEADSGKLELRKKALFFKDTFIIKIADFIIGKPEDKKVVKYKNVEKHVAAKQITEESTPELQSRKILMVKNEKPQQDQPTILEKKIFSDPGKKPVEKPFDVSNRSNQKRAGRNVKKNHFAISLNHFYSRYKGEIRERKMVTLTGTTRTVSNIQPSLLENVNPDTFIHRDILRIHYGVTNNLEIFADIGGAYNKISKGDLTYGGGGRFNFFDFQGQYNNRYYGAIQGEAFLGKIEYEYEGEFTNKWNKEADWQELSAKFEIGTILTKFSAYGGVSYSYFEEKTDRYLLNNFPTSVLSYKYEDEIREESSYGAFVGITYHLNKKLQGILEGQVGNPNKIAATLKYEFK